jgi:hypothetical protein
MIDYLKTDYPVAVICKTLGVSWISYYMDHIAKQADRSLLLAFDQILT